MRRFVLGALVIAMVLAMTPATAGAKGGGKKAMAPEAPDYFVVEESLPFAPLEGFENAEQLWGVHNGAGYRIEIPAGWNGDDLIMFAHGYRGEGAELFFNPADDSVPEVDPEFPVGVREWMLDQGYAWAMSTYSKNGYNVAQGVKDTHALSKYFNGLVGKPDRVYIMGYSMGGHISAVSGEQFSNTYSGAMPMCGVVGDYELFDYFLDFNAAAQQIALGQSQFPVGENYLGKTVPQIKAALGGPFFPFVLTPDGQRFAQLVELRSGGDRPDFEHAFRFWNSPLIPDSGGNFLFDLGTGNGALPGRPGVAVDNIGVEYQVDLEPDMSEFEVDLNAGIVRVEADASARKSEGLSNVPKISGELEIPTLTLHNIGDLFVPFHNEIVYGQEAVASGTDHLLVQRAIPGALHCDFAVAEITEGLGQLIDWAEGGPKPEGDEVLEPEVVAGENFGCQFARVEHFVGVSLSPVPPGITSEFSSCGLSP